MGERINPEIERFEFMSGRETRGLTATTFWNLYNICRNWGKVNPSDRAVVRFHSGEIGEYFELSVSTPAQDGNLNMMVVKYPKGTLPRFEIMVGKTHFPITTKAGGLVIWPRTLIEPEAKRAIEKIDINYRGLELIDTETGARKPLPREERLDRSGATTYRVDEIFSDPHTQWPASSLQEAELILSRFDDPTRLEVALDEETGLGFIGLRGTQEQVLNLTETMLPNLKRFLQKKGYSSIEEVPWSEVFALRDEFQRWLQERRR